MSPRRRPILRACGVLLAGLLLAANVRAAEPAAPEPPLHAAALAGDGATVRRLLAEGADVNQRNQWKETPLIGAVAKGHRELALYLLSRESDMTFADRDGNTPLHYAASRQFPEIVEDLIAAGAPIDPQNTWGETPLNLAVTKEGNARSVALLLEHGASLKLQAQLGTPLHYAIGFFRYAIAQTLLEAGADIDAHAKDDGATPLIRASRVWVKSSIELLLSHHPDLDARDDDGWTALMWACWLGNPALAEMLAEAGAGLEVVNEDGDTALVKAAQRGHFDIVRDLAARGAKTEGVRVQKSANPDSALTPARQWALAAAALLVQEEGREHGRLGGPPKRGKKWEHKWEARKELARDWFIDGPAQARQVLDALMRTGERGEFAAMAAEAAKLSDTEFAASETEHLADPKLLVQRRVARREGPVVGEKSIIAWISAGSFTSRSCAPRRSS